MKTYEHVRCLFCESGREQWVKSVIERLDYGHAVYPQKVKRLFRHGQWTEETKPLLPGYVFVFFDGDMPIRPLQNLAYVLRVLHYDSEPDGYLAGPDLDIAEAFLQRDGLVGALEAVRVGSWIEITDGLLKQFHGRVLQMDHRKQMAKIQLDIAGSANQVWLSYVCIEPAENDASAAPAAKNNHQSHET